MSQLCQREAELKKNLIDFLSYVSAMYLSALVQKLALALECGRHSFSIANIAIYHQRGGLNNTNIRKSQKAKIIKGASRTAFHLLAFSSFYRLIPFFMFPLKHAQSQQCSISLTYFPITFLSQTRARKGFSLSKTHP